MAIEPGQIIGRYRIRELIGEGGMGAVYLAEHTLMRKRVAMKLLRPEMTENPEAVARFEREALAAAHVEHPNVASATDFGKTADGAFFLVLEYVEGTNLRSLVGTPFSARRTLHIARQIALALERAHAGGIVHRDLKPENVMLVTRDGDPDFVKVLDFGIAKIPVGQYATETAGVPAPLLTKTGVVIGTFEYMSPEQSMGETVGPETDLYALGIMMYEMLTGVHPFNPPDRAMLMTMHVLEPIPRMNVRVPGLAVPEAVEAIVRRLLEKQASARYARASDLVRAIDGLMQTVVVEARTTAAPPSLAMRIGSGIATQFPILVGRIKGAPRAAFIAVGALVVLIVVVAVVHRTPASPPPGIVAGEAPSTSVPPRPTHAPPEAIEGAAGNVEALEKLTAKYPTDPAVVRALAIAYDGSGRSDDALRAITNLVALDPASDPAVVRIVLRQAARPTGTSADDAFTLLEGPLGPSGVDALIELGRTAPSAVRTRAQKSLERPEVRANASAAARIYLDFRAAASCTAKKELLERVGQDGDARILPALRDLRSKSGCGFLDLGDCWKCLRYDRALEEAIGTVSARAK